MARDDALDPDQDTPRAARLSWPRVVALVVAFGWLGGAVGWFVAQERPPGPGSVDAGFYLDMSAHHEQGVQLALMELARGSDPTVLGFAQEIVIFQQYELGIMSEQLRQWDLTVADREEQAMGWMGMPVAQEDMPGLASEEEIAAFQDTEGSAADAMFLDLMAEHHRGGVHMAAYAADRAATDGVRELASRMARNQGVEINEFRQTAERLGLDVDIAPFRLPQAET